MQQERVKKLTTAEMIDQIKNKAELDRVNRKLGKLNQDDSNRTPAKQTSNVSDTVLQKTTNLLEEAEALLAPDSSVAPTGHDSDLLASMTPPGEASGQRELDSDEMEDEMMDEHQSMVQPGWKILNQPA